MECAFSLRIACFPFHHSPKGRAIFPKPGDVRPLSSPLPSPRSVRSSNSRRLLPPRGRLEKEDPHGGSKAGWLSGTQKSPNVSSPLACLSAPQTWDHSVAALQMSAVEFKDRGTRKSATACGAVFLFLLFFLQSLPKDVFTDEREREREREREEREREAERDIDMRDKYY